MTDGPRVEVLHQGDNGEYIRISPNVAVHKDADLLLRAIQDLEQKELIEELLHKLEKARKRYSKLLQYAVRVKKQCRAFQRLYEAARYPSHKNIT